jgi:hypothetical protein
VFSVKYRGIRRPFEAAAILAKVQHADALPFGRAWPFESGRPRPGRRSRRARISARVLPGCGQNLALPHDQGGDQVFGQRSFAKVVLLQRLADQRPQQVERLAGLILDRPQDLVDARWVLAGMSFAISAMRTSRFREVERGAVGCERRIAKCGSVRCSQALD